MLPNGILRDGFFSATINRGEGVIARNSRTGATNYFDAAALGLSRSIGSDPNLASLGASSPSYDRFRIASQTTLAIQFDLAPNVTLNRTLRDKRLDPAAEEVAYDNLPDSFRKRVAEAEEAMKRGFRSVPGRQMVPPPLQ